MPEIGPSGSEGGVAQTNAPFLPLSGWLCGMHSEGRARCPHRAERLGVRNAFAGSLGQRALRANDSQ
jgi:hypothetical protein